MKPRAEATSTPVAQTPDVVRVLAEGLAGVLGARLVGLYLGGSTSVGEAGPASDFDVLVVTDGALTPRDRQAIGALHARLRREHPDGRRLEGDYAPRHLLAPAGTTAPVPGVRDGVFENDPAEIMLSADNIADMRLNGLAVYGPPAREILPAVTPDDVRAAAREMLLAGAGRPATEPEAAAYTLDLVRSLCALETGRPTTRAQGAAWALARLDRRWHGAIRRALAIRGGCDVAADDRTLRTALPAMDRALRPAHAGRSARVHEEVG